MEIDTSMDFENPGIGNFAEGMNIVFTSEDPKRVEGEMPVTPALYQPWGFVHGGATIAFLESLASRAAELNTDFEVERPFGIDVHVRHWKSAQKGTMHGYARLDRVEGTKQFWEVRATDDLGDTISDGVIITKIVSLARLEEKERERAAARAAENA